MPTELFNSNFPWVAHISNLTLPQNHRTSVEGDIMSQETDMGN